MLCESFAFYAKEKNMKTIYAVFRSKTETYKFIEYMREVGFDATAVSTPSGAKVGCGISAKISYNALNVANKIISGGRFSTFKGLFLIEKKGGRTSTVKI